MEHILDHDADIVFLTETWLTSDKNDTTAMVNTYGYKLIHTRRQGREKEVGGGVGILLKSSLTGKMITLKPFSSFEHTMVEIQLSNKLKMNLVTIYRLLFIAPNIFIDEFTEFLEMLSINTHKFVLSGDINFHLESNEVNAKRLNELFSTFNMIQYINFPTHNLGHTLDLVLSHSDSPTINNLSPHNVYLSDHYLIGFSIQVSPLSYSMKSISYRNAKAVINEHFISEIRERYNNEPSTDMKVAVSVYDSLMRSITDKYAPVKTKLIKIVPSAPWFDAEYLRLRKLRRKAEKKYRKSGLFIDREEFINLRKQSTDLALKKKQEYYSRKINQCNGNRRSLYTCLNELLDTKQESVLPSHNSNTELANRFQNYFTQKICEIRKAFSPKTSIDLEKSKVDHILNFFDPATEDELYSIITTYGIKCSPDDPIPAKLLKDNLDTFIPIWLKLVNLSLSQGCIDGLKNAILSPLIKGFDNKTDVDNLKNYRPVSNLPFLEKLIERVVSVRIENHMDQHNLHSCKQHGYKKHHSTEMLLTKIVNDLLLACDKKVPSVLMFIDLSAAFDTVVQNLLLEILHNEIGISGIPFKWFRSFLMGRTQKVKIDTSFSSPNTLDFGVAQGSILGPKLFNIYSKSFPDVILAMDYSVDGFADDHQIGKQFNPLFQVTSLGINLNLCFSSISLWMNENFLKINASKTKILVVAPPIVKNEIIINGTFIENTCIRFVDCAKNLGVLIDSELTFDAQVNKIVSACYTTLRLLHRIKSFLNTDQLKTLVCSLVLSKIDYCNALYYGINQQNIKKLQGVQNSAARLVYKINWFDRRHVSHLIKELHWLRVKERIVFKTLLTVHKCITNQAPLDLANKLTFSTSDRTRKLNIKSHKSLYGSRAFSVCGPKLWNGLPQNLRMEDDTLQFKKNLKTFLFTKAQKFYETVYIQ